MQWRPAAKPVNSPVVNASVELSIRRKVTLVVALFAAGLLVSAYLRLLQLGTAEPPPIASFATEIYIAITVLAAIALRRLGAPVQRLGFHATPKAARVLVLAAIGVALIQATGYLLDQLLGDTRDLTRFTDVSGSPTELAKLMALSWTFAAFGEELAFRILLMRGIAFALGDSRWAFGIALVVQAIVFGLVHAYQGPAGIVGTTIDALIFGGLTLAARGSIWPAAIAHGSSNSIGIMALYWSG